MSPRRALIALVLLLPSLATFATAPPASAKAIAVDDSFGVYDGSARSLDVLANDYDDAILFPKDLYICGLSIGAGAASKIYVYTDAGEPRRVKLLTAPGVTGLVSFTYSACRTGETTNATTATVKVRIRALKNLVVKRAKQRGKIRVINRNNTLVGLRWSFGSDPRPRGRRTLQPKQKLTITIKRSHLDWAALGLDGDGIALAGRGEVRGIQAKR